MKKIKILVLALGLVVLFAGCSLDLSEGLDGMGWTYTFDVIVGGYEETVDFTSGTEGSLGYALILLRQLFDKGRAAFVVS